MRLSFKKTLGLSLSALILSVAAYQIFNVYRSVQNTLTNTRARLIEQNRVPFEKRSLTPHLSQNIQISQNTNSTRDVVKFQDSFFAATSGGLIQLSDDGKLLKHFTVLDGLPESDLTCLTVFNGKLYIGTQTKNLITFDGERFENYVWTDRKAQAITSFLESDGKLLIGTRNGGLLEFDGKEFTEIKVEKERIKSVTHLYKNGAELYIGTFDNGLWLYKTGVWTHFTTAEGLPSNRIIGIAEKENKLYVATDFGLAALEEKDFRTIKNLPSLTSLVSYNNQLFLSKDNGDIFTFDTSIKELSEKENLQNSHLIAADEKLWLLTDQGILRADGAKLKPFGNAESQSLTDNFISALAFDAKENLWIGTFRRGIDVYARDGKKLTHLETESLREVNYIKPTAKTVTAATSGGLFKVKDNFSVENLTKKDGLPSNSITHLSGNYIATAKGLAFYENDKLRLISTVQGLPNNSLYTTLQVGSKLYVGTLGGLALIENNRVVRVFKDSNSNLTTNWVTALYFTNNRLFIGTYGGGIFELSPSGEIRSFEAETGKFTVNPNALFSDGERLFAGTLSGVKVLDLQTQGWTTVKSILPAETVMSITGNAENIYFGTTNGIAKIEKNFFTKGESE